MSAASARSQIAILWWSIGFMVLYSVAIYFMLQMVPPPSAMQSAEEVGQWYSERAVEIRIGATISGLSAGFMVPFWAVVSAQIWRQERGAPILTFISAMAGTMMALFITLSPICWGVAAFAPDRAPEITAMMHQFGVLAFVTTDQFSPFCWAAVAIVCFMTQRSPHSPFPRWLGYLSAWSAFVLEAGAFAFNFYSGPLAWDGFLVYWVPLISFGIWMGAVIPLLFRSLKAQLRDAEAAEAAGEQSGEQSTAVGASLNQATDSSVV